MDRTTPNVRDASLVKTKALPAAAGAANGDAIDLGSLSGRGIRSADVELLLSAPVLTATELPDTTTCTYKLEADDAANFASATTLVASAIVQTGNTGAAAATYRYKLPSNCKRYIRAVATTADVGNASAGNCAGKSMTLEMLF